LAQGYFEQQRRGILQRKNFVQQWQQLDLLSPFTSLMMLLKRRVLYLCQWL